MTLINHLIFPPRCCLCKANLVQDSDLCAKCYKNLPWNTTACQKCALPTSLTLDYCGNCINCPPLFLRNLSPFRYEPPVSSWIVQLKFHHQLYYAPILARQLAEWVKHLSNPMPECIIPVPLHHRRLRQRGFNQALEIAKIVAKILKIPLLTNSVQRVIHTRPQSKLNAQQRRSNLQKVFKVRSRIPFQHVAILDDVMTTGETAQALSQCLYESGLQKIEVWSCSRAA